MGAVQPLEGQEDPFLVLGGDADAVVLDDHPDALPPPLRADADPRLDARGRELQRVRQQIRQDLVEERAVGEDRGEGRGDVERGPPLPDLQVQAVARLPDGRLEVHRAQVQPDVAQPAVGQEVVDEGVHGPGALEDPLRGLRAFGIEGLLGEEELGEAVDRAQRRPQIVGHRGGEAFELLDADFQLLGPGAHLLAQRLVGLPQAFLGEPALREIADDLGVAHERPVRVAERGGDAAGPEAGAVLALEPVVVAGAAAERGGAELEVRQTPFAVFGDEDPGQVLPEDLVGAVAQEARRAFVPAGDAAVDVDEQDGEVLDALHEEAPGFLGPPGVLQEAADRAELEARGVARGPRRAAFRAGRLRRYALGGHPIAEDPRAWNL